MTDIHHAHWTGAGNATLADHIEPNSPLGIAPRAFLPFDEAQGSGEPVEPLLRTELGSLYGLGRPAPPLRGL